MRYPIFASVVGLTLFTGQANAMSDQPSRAERLEFATKLSSYFSGLNDAIPAPSPRELQWLDDEIASGHGRYTKRVLDAVFSTEGIERSVKSNMLSLLAALRTVPGPLSLQQEVQQWSTVTYIVTSENFGPNIELLIKRGVLRGPVVDTYKNAWDANYREIGSTILRGIIGPYIAGNLPTN